MPLILTNDNFSNNQAIFAGGGVDIIEDSGQVTITNSLFSNNSTGAANINALPYGGGLWVLAPLVMTGNTISANRTYGYGGGLYLQYGDSADYAQTLTANNFINNIILGPVSGQTAAQEDGGGVCIGSAYDDSASTAYVLHYNRFHGNMGGAHTGLGVGCQVATNGGNTTIGTVNATDNWWGCNATTAMNGASGVLSGSGCDSAGILNTSGPTLSVSPYTTLTLGLNGTTFNAGSNVVATASLGQDSASPTPTVYSAANDAAYLATPISTFTLTETATPSYNPSATTFSATANAAVSYAAATATGIANATATGTATLTVDGQTLTRTYNVTAPDLTIASTHSPASFKAGDTADTFTITVSNVGTGSTSGTTGFSDTLPSGFTATAYTGSGWTCTLGATTSCTSSNIVPASITFPALTLTVSVSGSDAGAYTNSVTVYGGGELNTNNDNGTDSINVVGTPTITEAFAPASIAPMRPLR